jgi:hypothetical protein
VKNKVKPIFRHMSYKVGAKLFIKKKGKKRERKGKGLERARLY